jgi:cobaltochelatase CobN
MAFIPTCEASSPHTLIEAAGEVSEHMDVDFYSAGLGVLPSAENVDLGRYDLVYVVGNSHETIKIRDAVEKAKKKTKVIVVSTVLLEGNVALEKHPDIERYYFNRSRENFKRLMVYLAVKFCGLKHDIQPPIVYPEAAIYHPEAESLFLATKEYLRWYANAGRGGRRYDKDALTAGVFFYQSDYTKENTGLLDSVVRALESRGCNAFAFFAKDPEKLTGFLTPEKEPSVDVVLSFNDQIYWSDYRLGIEKAREVNVPILYAPSHYYQTRKEWEDDQQGLGGGMASQLTYSELNGMFEPILIGAKKMLPDGRKIKEPIDYQLDWRIDRAIAWAKLRRMNNADKKIVIPYYSEGGGKGNVGADIDYYLDAQASLANMLKQMEQRGYNLGPRPVFDKKVLATMMAEQGSNIGVWNRREIQKRVNDGSAVIIPYEKYMAWFNEIDTSKQREVIDAWGPPPGNIMTCELNGKKCLVIPKIQFGNIVLCPHPTWGFLQDKKNLYSDGAIPPHHQYIAFWYWINREFKANAAFTVFTQISLMPGKQAGLSRNDWGGILLQGVPNIHPFPIQANSGLHNKRKANALIIDYMPTIVTSGVYEGLLTLKNKIDMYERAADRALKTGYANGIIDEVRKLHIDEDLKLDSAGMRMETLLPRLSAYIDEINREHMPYGPHTLSEPPEGAELVEMVRSMLGTEYTGEIRRLTGDTAAAKQLLDALILENKAPEAAQAAVFGKQDKTLAPQCSLALDYAARIRGCEVEIPRILDAMEGAYIEPGPMDDPIRNPESLPTGRNPQSLDPRTFPTAEAWETGKRLADQMLAQHKEKNGAFPDKVAFVLWSSEITKTHGVLEAQILWLLGVKPVWRNGRVKDVELIGRRELGRGRIDVVITTSGTYRDIFQEKIDLLDKAVQLAAQQKEKDNRIAQNSRYIEKQLRKSGQSEESARAIATARIFSEAPGAYSPNIQFAIPAGDTWKDDKEISDLYMSRVSYLYGEKFDGEAAKDAFRHNLQNVDAGVFSRSSNVYGILEHPMVAAYFGGLKMAVRNTSGKKIDMYIANLRSDDNAKMETLERFYIRELRSRYFNPKWIRGMKEHGYDGARYMETFTENMWIWDVTSPEMVTENNWNEAYEVYVKDRYDLDLAGYFDKNNPYALQSMVSTMLEVAEKGYWKPAKEVFEDLVKVYAQSVAAHGISGAYGSTDVAMHKDVSDVLKKIADVPPELMRQYAQQVKTSTEPLQKVKGYEVKEVKNDTEERKFKLGLGFVLLVLFGAAIAAGWLRARKKSRQAG